METPREVLQRNLAYLNGQIAVQSAKIEDGEKDLASREQVRAELVEAAAGFTAALNHLNATTKETTTS